MFEARMALAAGPGARPDPPARLQVVQKLVAGGILNSRETAGAAGAFHQRSEVPRRCLEGRLRSLADFRRAGLLTEVEFLREKQIALAP
jgi:hypothetical protein